MNSVNGVAENGDKESVDEIDSRELQNICGTVWKFAAKNELCYISEFTLISLKWKAEKSKPYRCYDDKDDSQEDKGKCLG